MSEKHVCPYCQSELGPWEGAPETGWGLLYVCCNNSCSYFLDSRDCLESQGGSHRGYRYAIDPENNNEVFPLVTWLSDSVINYCQSKS